MSNYLSRLAARSLNLTAGLKPRLASMFEPPAMGGELAFERRIAPEPAEEWSIEMETPLTLQQRTERPTTLPAVNAQPPSSANSRFIPPAPQPIPRASVSPITSTTEPGSPSASAPSSAEEQDGANQTTSPWPSMQLQPVQSGPVQEQPVRTEMVPSPARAILSAISKPLSPVALEPLAQLSEREESAPSTSPVRKRRASPSAQSEPRADATLTITPRLAPPPREPERKERTAAESAPTIRVTIGRVEVRAVLPPAPPTPATPATPPAQALSLDEYLRSRTGGQR